MSAYIIRRLLLMIPTIFLVTIIAFATVRFIPGNVIDLMVAEMAWESGLGTELTAETIRHALGMDLPIHVQYGRWLGVWPGEDGTISGVLQGNLGRSLWTNRVVLDDILRRLPVSLELSLMALATAMLLALPIGTYSAIRQDTRGDYIGRTVAVLAISLPSFWVGTMVIVYPSILIGWSPPVELIPFTKDPVGNIFQFLLPAVIQGLVMSGTTMRLTRTMMLEVLRQDYIRTAWAKGLVERTVVVRHALKNALIPVVSMIGLLLAGLLAATVIIEQIFTLPGIGLLLIEALNKRDYPVISGINLFIAVFVMSINLLIDLSYAYLDPRLKFK